MLRKFFIPFLLCIVFLFVGCASLRGRVLSAEEEALLYPVESYVPEEFDWQEIRISGGAGAGEDMRVVPGVWRFDFKSRDPSFPLIYHAVKIELSASGSTGADDGQGSRSEADAGERGVAGAARFTLENSLWERTADFAAREECLVAMNATPFDKTRLAGICKVDGKNLSQPVARYAALGLRCAAGGQVLEGRIYESQTDVALADCEAAFGGFFVVLGDGQVCTDFVRRHTSRSGAGLSADGKTLYLLVVEGEHPRQSMGLSYPQCGEIFRAMGCSHALEFDGGGSSELCINGRSVISYRVGRVQGNSFGFSLMSSSDLSQGAVK